LGAPNEGVSGGARGRCRDHRPKGPPEIKDARAAQTLTRQLIIGSRGSALARWQAEHVRDRLRTAGREVEIRIITTTGDRIQDRRLDVVGGKGAFLKEIEEALLRGEVDLAVHSLKDVPTQLTQGLALVAYLERADPRDALLSRTGEPLRGLARGATVGTTSLRRRSQLLALRPDLEVTDLRGNVDTRIRRLREGRCDAIVLALAGLQRLGRQDEATELLEPPSFLPAPGQGAIVVETRADDPGTMAVVTALDHAETRRAVTAERTMLDALGGGCNVPLGAYARRDGGSLHLQAFVASPDGARLVRAEARGEVPEALGRAVAERLRATGADELLLPA
jgi:hydroxymethylbilane synthase